MALSLTCNIICVRWMLGEIIYVHGTAYNLNTAYILNILKVILRKNIYTTYKFTIQLSMIMNFRKLF